MKKITIILSLITLVTVITGCNRTSLGDPRAVADKFTEAFIVKLDPDEMMKYCNASGREEIREELIEAKKQSPEMYDFISAAIKDLKLKYQYDDIRSYIEDDEADIWYIITSDKDPGFATAGNVELVREGNSWKVEEWDFSLF